MRFRLYPLENNPFSEYPVIRSSRFLWNDTSRQSRVQENYCYVVNKCPLFLSSLLRSTKSAETIWTECRLLYPACAQKRQRNIWTLSILFSDLNDFRVIKTAVNLTIVAKDVQSLPKRTQIVRVPKGRLSISVERLIGKRSRSLTVNKMFDYRTLTNTNQSSDC